MTSKSGFFVFILIASGCLSKACGDGEISTSPRSFEAAPTPDQPNVDEPTPDQSDVDEPASGVKGAPYVHVTPADIGVTIGPGVIAPYPTEAYTGSCNITADDVTIENKVVNCAKFRVDGDNFTMRNSVVATTNGVHIGSGDGKVLDFLMEYSHVSVTNGDSAKAFEIWGSYPGNDFRNLTVRKSHIQGGFDLVAITGNLEGVVFENSVMGPTACPHGSNKHQDGWQLSGGQPTYGTWTIRGNYINPGENCGRTAGYFGSLNDSTVIIESNHLEVWGFGTLWAADNGALMARYNVYSQEFKTGLGNACNATNQTCGHHPGDPDRCCAYPEYAAKWQAGSVHDAEATCNRYQDGTFVEDQWFQGPGGVTHDITGCPDFDDACTVGVDCPTYPQDCDAHPCDTPPRY